MFETLEPWIIENYRGIVAAGRDAEALANEIEGYGASRELVSFVRSLIVEKAPARKENTRSAKPVEKR